MGEHRETGIGFFHFTASCGLGSEQRVSGSCPASFASAVARRANARFPAPIAIIPCEMARQPFMRLRSRKNNAMRSGDRIAIRMNPKNIAVATAATNAIAATMIDVEMRQFARSSRFRRGDRRSTPRPAPRSDNNQKYNDPDHFGCSAEFARATFKRHHTFASSCRLVFQVINRMRLF